MNLTISSILSCKDERAEYSRKNETTKSKKLASKTILETVRYGPGLYFVKLDSESQKNFLNLNEGYNENLRIFEGAEFEKYFENCNSNREYLKPCLTISSELRLFAASFKGVPSFVSKGWSNGCDLQEIQGDVFVIYDRGNFIYRVSTLISAWLVLFLLCFLGLFTCKDLIRKARS